MAEFVAQVPSGPAEADDSLGHQQPFKFEGKTGDKDITVAALANASFSSPEPSAGRLRKTAACQSRSRAGQSRRSGSGRAPGLLQRGEWTAPRVHGPGRSGESGMSLSRTLNRVRARPRGKMPRAARQVTTARRARRGSTSAPVQDLAQRLRPAARPLARLPASGPAAWPPEPPACDYGRSTPS